MNIGRRDMMRLLAGMAGCAALPIKAAGPAAVPLGIQTYSLREMLNTPGDMVDKMIAALLALGVTQCELFEPTLQPARLSRHASWASPGVGQVSAASLYGAMPVGPRRSAESLAAREAVRQWRLATGDAWFVGVGQRFADAGIEILAFNFLLKDDCTDAEVERGFAMTRALGTGLMTASTSLTMARRCVSRAEQHGIAVAMHNHSNLSDPNQFATPDSFAQALEMSALYRINLDLGHFSAAGFDAIPFIRQHHARISNLHIKDRLNHDGRNMPYGEGDTPIREVLRLNRDQAYRIPCTLEYEYAGTQDAVSELRRCLDYVKAALA